MKYGLLICLSLIFFGCSKPKTSNSHFEAKTSDFGISYVSDNFAEKLALEKSSDEDCEQHIRNISCLSEGLSNPGVDESCSKEKVDLKQVESLIKIIHELPPLHQKIMCHLSILQIHPKLNSVGFASPILNAVGTEIIGMMFGIRSDSIHLDSAIDMNTWKEQLNFGLTSMFDPDYHTSNLGPKIQTGIVKSQDPFLLHLVTHEISHLVDFINGANNEDFKIENELRNVSLNENSFGLLSWPAFYNTKADNSEWPPVQYIQMYQWLSKKLYYSIFKFNKEFIKVENINDVYQELDQSNFLTSYSAANEFEDFAEASTAFLLKEQGFYYRIIGPGEKVLFDIDKKWDDPKTQSKIKWIKDFYSRTDLKFKFD